MSSFRAVRGMGPPAVLAALMAPLFAFATATETSASEYGSYSSPRPREYGSSPRPREYGSPSPRYRGGRGISIGGGIGIAIGAAIVAREMEKAQRAKQKCAEGYRRSESGCVKVVRKSPPEKVVRKPPPEKVVKVVRKPPPEKTVMRLKPPTRRSASLPSTPPSQAVEEFVADQVLVTTARSAPQSLEEDVARDHRLQLIERLDVTLLDRRIVRMRIPDGRAVETVIAGLRSDLRIGEPQPNYLYRRQASPAGVAGVPQYALGKIDARSAHALAEGRGALVAIIDSAVDLTHPDLGAVAAEMFDAVGDADSGPDAHGTAIAGIIGARGTMQGVAPEAKLLCVRVFTPKVDRNPAATSAILLRGLEWSVAQGARVLNLSFAGPRDPLVHKTLKEAANAKQAIIVAAAGNNGASAPPAYPGAYEEVIAVTAIDQADRLYKQANRGAYIAIAAPGVDILVPTLGGAHQHQTGTSFAAAHVSGIIALMLERNPGLSAKAVREALMKTAQDLGRPGRDKEFGAGRANAFKSLKMIEQLGKLTH